MLIQKMEKIIIKHYEVNESALDKQYDALEHISSAYDILKEKKFKDVLDKLANDVLEDIRINDSQLQKNIAEWEACVGKYFKGKVKKSNQTYYSRCIIHPYKLVNSCKRLFVLIADLDDHYKGIEDKGIELEGCTEDWELEEITREEFKKIATEQTLSIVDYRYTRNIEKSQTNCRTDEDS